MVSTAAGTGTAGNTDGTGTTASFTNPAWCTFYQYDTYLLVSTLFDVRKIVYSTWAVTTLAGGTGTSFADGVGSNAGFNQAIGIAVTSDNIAAIVADQNNHRIRRIELSTATVTTLAGSGTAGAAYGVGTNAQFNGPLGNALYPIDGSFVLITSTPGNTVLKLDISTATVSLFAGVYLSTGSNSDGTGTGATFNVLGGISFDPSGSYVVCAESGPSSNTIRKLTYPGAVVTTLAGGSASSSTDGTGSSASFNGMIGITIDVYGNYAIVAERDANKLRKIILSTAVVSTFVGTGASGRSDGTASTATLNGPYHVCLSKYDNAAVVAAWNENDIRLVERL